MPTYNETWDETKPAGTRDRSLGDDDIREFKRAIRERLAQDHSMEEDESGVATIGYHKKVTLVKQTSNPGNVTGAGVVFTKDAGSGAIELFYLDAVGNVTQLTSAGGILALGTSAWRTGDKILSSNTNTPTGWTDISATYTENFIRISSGVPLTTGGANTHDHGGTTGSESSHTHTFTGTTGGDTWNGSSKYDGSSSQLSVPGHTHPFSGTTAAGSAHSHSVASANNVPVYVQMRMYSKN